MRFFPRFGSGTLLKYHAGSARSPSAPPIEAKTSLLPASSREPLLPASSGRPSRADQKFATLKTSPQSKAILPTFTTMAPPCLAHHLVAGRSSYNDFAPRLAASTQPTARTNQRPSAQLVTSSMAYSG